MYNFRELRADEIELRVGRVGKGNISLLLYQDARAAMNVLDETVGPFNWQNEYTRENRNCKISIWDSEKSQWISKEDTGTESYTEKEKGLASDSFKRAAVRWGIGRELYTAPPVYIAVQTNWENNKYVLVDKRDGYGYKVESIEYTDGKITELTISKDGMICYQYPAAGARKVDAGCIAKVRSLAQTKGVPENKICGAYGIKSLDDMTGDNYRDAVMRLLA